MKKLLFLLPLLALLAGAAVAGTSYLAGSQTENEYQQLLQKLNEQTPLTFVNESYEAGLGSSSAVTQVMSGSDPDAHLLFKLHHDIRHVSVRVNDDGLKLGTVSIDTTFHDEATLSPKVQAALSDDTLLTVTTDARFDGQITNLLTVSGIEMSEEGESFFWSGINMDSVTQGSSSIGSGTLGSFTYTDDNIGGNVSVEGSEFAFDVQAQGDAIFTGTGDVTISKISISNPAELPAPVSIDAIRFVNVNDLEGGAINSVTSIDINNIDAPAPSNFLKNASSTLEFNGLLLDGLRQYNALMQALGDVSDVSMMQQMMRNDLADALRAMVEPGSAIKIALALDNDQGDLAADIRVGVKDATADGMAADALDNIVTGRDLLNVLTVNGQLDADTAAIAETPLMIVALMLGDYMTTSEESITSDVELVGTTLVINGIEMPLDQLTGGMLDIPFSDLLQM